MKAYNLARIDKEYDMHLQAWLHQMAKSTKNVGTDKKPKHEPVYKTFQEFFDYEKRLEEVQGTKKSVITPRMKMLARIAAKANEGR